MSEVQSTTNVDGIITKTEDARVPVLDRGFLYGDSVYEVFRTYGGVPLFYQEHWTRLENSARLVHMDLGYSKDEIGAAIRKTVDASGAPEVKTDVYVRYAITRGEGPVDLFPGPGLPTRYVIIVKPVPPWNPDFFTTGMQVAIPPTRRNPANALSPNVKGDNYLNNVIGVIEARKWEADDCIFLDDHGLVTEASNSNVFFVIDGQLVTPDQKAGNLRGLTKGAIHEACKQKGLESIERAIAADELARASECFVTSATREVMPVRRLRLEDGSFVEFPAGGGEITKKVAAYYTEYIEAYVRSNAALALF